MGLTVRSRIATKLNANIINSQFLSRGFSVSVSDIEVKNGEVSVLFIRDFPDGRGTWVIMKRYTTVKVQFYDADKKPIDSKLCHIINNERFISGELSRSTDLIKLPLVPQAAFLSVGMAGMEHETYPLPIPKE